MTTNKLTQKLINQNRYLRMLARHPNFKGRKFFWLNKKWHQDMSYLRNQQEKSMHGFMDTLVANKLPWISREGIWNAKDIIPTKSSYYQQMIEMDSQVISSDTVEDHYLEREQMYLEQALERELQ